MKKFLVVFFLILMTAFTVQKITVDSSESNTVKFRASATFGDFNGVTSAIHGEIDLNDNLLNGSKFNFIVYLDSLDTGIGLRNTHMREKYLETNKFPTAEFTGKIISSDSISNSQHNVKVLGEMKIHGAAKEITVPAKIYNYGKLYKIESDFPLKLSDFKIDSPSFLFNKVDDMIKINLNFYLK